MDYLIHGYVNIRFHFHGSPGPICGPLFLELLGTGALLPWICWFQCSKMHYIRQPGSLPKLLCPPKTVSYCRSLDFLLFVNTFWTLWSKEYLVHGTYFHSCLGSSVRKCTIFDYLAAYQNCCVPKADFNFVEASVCTIVSLIHETLDLKAMRYMENTSTDIFAQVFNNVHLYSILWINVTSV